VAIAKPLFTEFFESADRAEFERKKMETVEACKGRATGHWLRVLVGVNYCPINYMGRVDVFTKKAFVPNMVDGCEAMFVE
jgi:hypothetical protein